MEAREILQRGIRWQVGDGHFINIWNDPWIPRPYTFRPFIRQANAPTMVKDIILSDLSWNRDFIIDCFEVDDAALILSIPLSTRRVPDRLIWHYDTKGRFSTKSAYKLAFDLTHNMTLAAAGSEGISNFWKQI